MNAYLFSSIQSAAYGNLFECSTHDENGCDIVFSSMSHENEVGVMDDGEELLFASLLNTEGLKAKFPSCRSVRCVLRRSERVWGSIATRSLKPKCGETPAPSRALLNQHF